MDKPWLIAILGVALFLRIGAAVGIHTWLSRTGKIYLIEGDAEGYWTLGEKLAHGEPYQVHQPPRKVMRMPGYPLLIAGSLALFGDSRLAVRLIQAVLASLAVWLVAWLGWRLCDTRTGLVAAGILAISPAVVGFTPLLLSETLFAVLLVVNLAVAVRWIKDNQSSVPWTWTILTGMTTVIVVYVRPTWLPALLIWSLLAVIYRKGRRRWLEATVLLMTGILCLLPWGYRNYQVTGHWVLTTLWVGPSLYDSLNPEADGSSNMAFFDREDVMGSDGLTEYEMDRHYRRRTKEFLSAHPAEAVGLMWAHLQRFASFVPNAAQFQHSFLRFGLFGWSAAYFLFGLIGIWKIGFRCLPLVCVVGPMLGFALVHTVFVGSLRYRLPAEYPFSIAVAVGVLFLWDRWRDSRDSSSPQQEVTA
ncbi:MAG: glycosyltransferase family 39 protein [Planctomycetaceae bacterium]|nr:glycosyltransferase family 39 protein [Planctomycetaceae bacterium]